MATMKDVAALANVGVGTVSRVLNDSGAVKESTRRKVQAAMKELNYIPNAYARGLKMNKTYTVALIIPTIWHPFFSEFAYYVERNLSEHKFKMLLCNSDVSNEKELEYIQMVQENKVDGIIGITYSDLDNFVSSHLPFVTIDRHFKEETVCVTSDNFQAGQLAVEKLVEKGCRKLGYIGTHSRFPSETTKRRAGFVEQAERMNIPYAIYDEMDPVLDLLAGIKTFFEKHPDVDGVFAHTDFIALDILEVLDAMERHVPEEIQIIGCDGIKMEAGRRQIVSTIRQPVDLMAQAAVKKIIELIDGEAVKEKITLPVTYIEGPTTKNNCVK
ncbi:transcription regulator hth laci [Trichococcus palustris]|uniref:Transcription regulator hth laci n=1 Tax=Trichococcus palustris TaxID=140314 RepID=A0A143YGA8_9LACT|nr:LacI family DNA-binding transcriptional regulator [Trichococcus palustris]CZQ88503.1 transcription regulator hth laci [Trichococcus palustris]SFL12672.1 transcriptional regulator, LacI family [Trichococcus palustris]